MGNVSGNVRDIVMGSMAGKVVQLVFRLNAPNVQATGTWAGTIHPTVEERVTPDSTGAFSVSLVTTTLMLGDAWYELGIVWQGSKEPLWDYPEWQIRVSGDGPINEMITLGPPGGGWGGPIGNLSLVLLSLTKPPQLKKGQLWWKTDPDDPNNLNGLNTGNIYQGV